MKKKKRSMTLLEIMVVIFIIGLIGTVIGVNMKGSLEEGKAFKSEKGSKQVYDLLSLEVSRGSLQLSGLTHAKAIAALSESGLASDVNKLIEDGWGKSYQLYVSEKDQEIRVVSENFSNYLQNKKKMRTSQIKKKYPWMNGTGCKKLASH